MTFRVSIKWPQELLLEVFESVHNILFSRILYFFESSDAIEHLLYNIQERMLDVLCRVEPDQMLLTNKEKQDDTKNFLKISIRVSEV